MREQTEINDKWFFDNGYFKQSFDTSSAHRFAIVTSTDKFKALVETCIRNNGKYKIITPEDIMKVLKDGNAKRERKLTYVKVTPEEKLRRKRERQRIKAERKLKNANTGIK